MNTYCEMKAGPRAEERGPQLGGANFRAPESSEGGEASGVGISGSNAVVKNVKKFTVATPSEKKLAPEIESSLQGQTWICAKHECVHVVGSCSG